MSQKSNNQPTKLNALTTMCTDWLDANQPYDAAHDRLHLNRVVKVARTLAIEENADIEVVEVAAWLHDCVIIAKSSPLRSKASQLSANKAREILVDHDLDPLFIDKVAHAIEAHSFSAGLEVNSIEAAVLRDADRLDAIGAVGLYRVIAAGAHMNRPLYCENDPFCTQRVADDELSIVDHFYTKLLQLQNSMLTESGKKEAQHRTLIMTHYLDDLKREIDA